VAKKEEFYEVGATSKDRTNRFAVDDLLRSLGFRIHTRSPRKTLWELNGALYHEEEIKHMLDPLALWNAEYMEMLYWHGFEQ
jgi:hypothetical protein